MDSSMVFVFRFRFSSEFFIQACCGFFLTLLLFLEDEEMID